MNVKVIHTKGLRWIDVVSPGEEEMEFLKTHFSFHPLHYADVGANAEHPKIESHADYHFIVLLFPVFNRDSRTIVRGEVDFFVGNDYLITIHDGSMHTMINMVKNVDQDSEKRHEFMSKNSGLLLYKILESLFKRSFPILDHMNRDMNVIEKHLFDDLSVKMLEEISLMKRNIIDFRRIMKTHHLILKRLMNRKDSYLTFPNSKFVYSELIEQAENIWDILAIQKETIEALQDANQSLATNRLNQVTKIMTVFSAIFLPATLVMFTFGLSLKHMPLFDNPDGFWIIVAIAASASLLTLIFFKFKKWF